MGLKPRWGHLPLDGVFPLVPDARHGGADGAERGGRRAALVGARPAARVPEPRLEGLTVGLLRRAPELGDGRETESSDAVDEWAGELERLGARVVEAAIPPRKADMWPLFLHEAAQSHRETFPSRADEYGPMIRPKLEAALSASTPDAVATAYDALARLARATSPTSTST